MADEKRPPLASEIPSADAITLRNTGVYDVGEKILGTIANGHSIEYSGEKGGNHYLSVEEFCALGSPKRIRITITAEVLER